MASISEVAVVTDATPPPPADVELFRHRGRLFMCV